jgi:hypothetical protein
MVGFLVAVPGVNEARRLGGMEGESAMRSRDEAGEQDEAGSLFNEPILSLLFERLKLVDRCMDKRRKIMDFLFFGRRSDGGGCCCRGLSCWALLLLVSLTNRATLQVESVLNECIGESWIKSWGESNISVRICRRRPALLGWEDRGPPTARSGVFVSLLLGLAGSGILVVDALVEILCVSGFDRRFLRRVSESSWRDSPVMFDLRRASLILTGRLKRLKDRWEEENCVS